MRRSNDHLLRAVTGEPVWIPACRPGHCEGRL